MTKKYTYSQKNTGDALTAAEWNNLAQDVDAAVDAINAGSTGTGNIVIGDAEGDSHIYLNAKGNLCIETTATNTPAEKKGKINIESRDDIQIKPGDDFTIVSSHRPVANMDEVSVKIHDGEDHPVKLQLNTADIVLTTKDKDKTMEKDSNGDDTTTPMYSDPTVMNVTVNSAKNTRGYLKVRAQAIDLRSESHGGIALQPKGYDNKSNMNKIKFEHGGGDGLEFGTFNTEHTSIFTNDYRFNKNGVWKMATREKEVSDKYDNGDETTHYKYVKKDDDFYDVIDNADASATTQNIIETAHAFNNANVGITPDGMVHIPPTGSFTGDVDYLLCISGLSALIPDNLCTTATVTDPDNTINFIIGQYYKTQNINDTFGITIDTNDLASKTYLKLTVVVGDAQKRYYFKKAISCSLADIVLYINYAKANNDGVFAVQSTQDTSDNTSGGVSENPDAGGIS